MSTAKRLERIERRLGVQDEEAEAGAHEDQPVALWLSGRRALRSLLEGLRPLTPAELAGFEADEARAAALPPGGTVRVQVVRLTESVQQHLGKVRAGCPRAPAGAEPSWPGPPARPFDPGEAERRGVEPGEAEEDG